MDGFIDSVWFMIEGNGFYIGATIGLVLGLIQYLMGISDDL